MNQLEKNFAQQITLEEMSKEISRELVTRKRVYPRWVADGKINQQTADFRCLVLEALLRKLCREVADASPQADLFQDVEYGWVKCDACGNLRECRRKANKTLCYECAVNL
ncbi:MAG: hypothetical protein M3367_15675 [Acidobacteriota bacterium]|nr:hypothetical protein [Acidobacteriota bacterium]